MEQYTKTMITFGVLIAVLFGLYFFSDWFSKTTGYVLGEDEKIVLAQCLSTKGATFYRSATCPSCDRQLDLFGIEATRYLNIVSCSTPEECPEGGVPSWRIGKTTIYGMKELDELITFSGCNVN